VSGVRLEFTCRDAPAHKETLMFSKKKNPSIRSLIAIGSDISGNLKFTDGLRIDGSVHGNIHANPEQPSLLVVSESAMVEGEIHADHVIINGKVNGPVFANDLLELQPKAQIQGDIHYKSLEMHQGAVISGHLIPAENSEKPSLKLAANNG
jgi:cytoskeletal protein CcmA (bactofilin family)